MAAKKTARRKTTAHTAPPDEDQAAVEVPEGPEAFPCRREAKGIGAGCKFIGRACTRCGAREPKARRAMRLSGDALEDFVAAETARVIFARGRKAGVLKKDDLGG